MASDHRAPQQLHRLGIGRDVLAPLGLDVLERNAQQKVVDVVAAQVRVAVGRQHLEDAVVQSQDGDVERAAAQVVHGDDAFLRLSSP